MFQLLRDLVAFARYNRMWWILPIVVGIVLIGGLVLLAESSAIAPWIYAMF
jgi:hypothetical protein